MTQHILDREYGKFDSSTFGVSTVEYEHHEIHAGSHYFLGDHATLGNGAVINLCIEAPDTTKWAHIIFEVEGTQAIVFQIYEGSDFDSDGTSITPINNNRNSTNTSGLTFQSDPTINAAGTELYSQYKGAQRSAGLVVRSREIIVKQNTDYIFRVTNQEATNTEVSWTFEWYEHTNKAL